MYPWWKALALVRMLPGNRLNLQNCSQKGLLMYKGCDYSNMTLFALYISRKYLKSRKKNPNSSKLLNACKLIFEDQIHDNSVVKF